jgi:hypothetical protein
VRASITGQSARGLATTPSRADAILVTLFLGSFVVAGASTTADPDLFHVLGIARETIARGSVPMQDDFAFTPTREIVVHHEWLTGMRLYPAAALGGSGLLILAHAIHLVAVAIPLLLARRNGASVVALALLGPLGIGMALSGLTVLRAHVLTLVFVGALLWCLDADRRGSRRWLIVWIPLQIAWQNCHGGFVIGTILVALHVVEQRLRGATIGHLLALIAATPALTLLSPYGAAYPAYLWEALRMDRGAIGEWHVLADGDPLKLPVWGLATLVFVYSIVPTGLRRAPGWLLLLVMAVGAYRYQRLLSIYAVVWLALVPPLIARTRLDGVFRRLWTARPMVTRAVLLTALLATIVRDVAERRWELRIPGRPEVQGGIAYPVAIVDDLHARGASGTMITPFEAGAFVSWYLHPAVEVSLDGRYEAAFDPSLVREHMDFFAAMPGWQGFLARYRPDFVLAKATDPVVPLLRGFDEWREIDADDAFVVFARSGIDVPHVDDRGHRPMGRL